MVGDELYEDICDYLLVIKPSCPNCKTPSDTLNFDPNSEELSVRDSFEKDGRFFECDMYCDECDHVWQITLKTTTAPFILVGNTEEE